MPHLDAAHADPVGMIAGAVTQLLVWAGAGLGALGGVVLVAGTVAVMLLGRDSDVADPGDAAVRPAVGDADGPADLAAAA